MAEIHYTKNGKIYYKSLTEVENDEKWKNIDGDINNTLNINYLSLMDNRKRAYESAKKTLEIAAKRKSYDSMKAKLLAEWETKHLDSATGEYKYKPFCGMLIYHLRK